MLTSAPCPIFKGHLSGQSSFYGNADHITISLAIDITEFDRVCRRGLCASEPAPAPDLRILVEGALGAVACSNCASVRPPRVRCYWPSRAGRRCGLRGPRSRSVYGQLFEPADIRLRTRDTMRGSDQRTTRTFLL